MDARYLLAETLEARIERLERQNKTLKAFVLSMGDRLVSQGEKFAVIAEKKLIKVDRGVK